MVDEDHLESLDFMLWMASSYRASALTHLNQSTVIRRARHVLKTFDIDICRSCLGWSLHEHNNLLSMERAIHQQFRFRGRRPLRLHIPFWSHRAVRDRLPRGWITNGADPSHCCENPLQLLRMRVLDACILTPTQLDPHALDLQCTELYHSSIYLTFFHSSPKEKDSSEFMLVEQIKTNYLPQLHLFSFLPRTCHEMTRQWFESLFRPSDDSAPSTSEQTQQHVKVAFLTPEMRATLSSSYLVDTSSPRPYRETLVVLRENAQHARFLELLEAFVQQFSASGIAQSTLRNQREMEHNSRSTQF